MYLPINIQIIMNVCTCLFVCQCVITKKKDCRCNGKGYLILGTLTKVKKAA